MSLTLHLALAASAHVQQAKPEATGFGDFIPLTPDFGPLGVFAKPYRKLAGVGFAVMALSAVAGIVIGFIRMGFAGADVQKAVMSARQLKNGVVVLIAAFVIGVVLVGVAAFATTIR